MKIFEEMKVDVGVAPVSINGNSTSPYFNLADYRKAIAVVEAGLMAITKTVKLEVYQAKNAAAGSAKLLAGATATITANINVASLTLALSTVLVTHTIIINGLTFTAHTDTTTVALREFAIDGATDTLDGDELCICLNDPTYGVPGVTAVNNAGTITLTATDPGAEVITAAQGVGATITVATLKAEAYVELDALILEKDFTHVATKVTTDATIVISSLLLRGGQRVGITQAVGASASV